MRTKYIILSLFLFLFQNLSFPQQDAVNDKPDAFIKNVREELKLKTGLSISVVKDGKVYFSKAYGFADIENGVMADTDTPFYIASSTKSFLGTLAKILSDEGVIDLDSPISVYLPELELQPPLNPDIITIRDLLTHRSGIESFAVILRTAFTGQQTDEKIMELFGSAEFTKREFRYTNTDYVLVSLIISKVTGKDWKELMNEKIFTPLKMEFTKAE